MLNIKEKKPVGLTSQLKEKLAKTMLERQLKKQDAPSFAVNDGLMAASDPLAAYCQFENWEGYKQIKLMQAGAVHFGIPSPFFKVHTQSANNLTHIDGKEYINFANYNYLGLSGHPSVNAAAQSAIDMYGTSVSASRPVAGERPIQQELEQALAEHYGVDDAIVFVSGHATNVTTLGYLFGAKDLIIHDSLIHNSVLQGIQLSGAKRLFFPHNNWQALDALLHQHRKHYERVLIVIEGLYSMDGDYPDLARFIDIKQRHHALLMVDEAHALGVLGETGKGSFEACAVNPLDVDIWMGTLSKTLAGCGGYIAGKHALIENLKYFAPGFLYSVGISPPVAAASLAALRILQAEPQRVKQLQANGAYFLSACRKQGINTGVSQGFSVVPAIIGDTKKTSLLSHALFEAGLNVQPIFYPAVEEKMARLRFFICSEHTTEQLQYTVDALNRAL